MSAIGKDYDSSAAFDLVQLRYVRAIASAGSMTAAAKRLRVSQPTLSIAVRDLESHLGTSLFLRGPKGVITTASGDALIRATDEVFALLRQADEEIRGLEVTPSGRFVVGCYHSFGAYFLPELMRGLHERAPGIDLALWEGTAPDVRDAVVDRTVHFGVAVWPRPHPDLVLVPMFEDVMGVICARRAPPDDAPLFYVPRILSSEKVVEALRVKRKLPARVVPCGDLELVKSLVLHGAGIGVLPWRVATANVARGAVRLVDPKWPVEIDVGYLFYRGDLHRTRGALLVRDELARRGKDLAKLALPRRVT